MSFVMKMSPGAIVSGGYSSRNRTMLRGTVPMNDGMLSVACASDRPCASVSTQAKSFDSRTTVENDVRTSAAAASSTIEISRVHSISSVTALKRCDFDLLRLVISHVFLIAFAVGYAALNPPYGTRRVWRRVTHRYPTGPLPPYV